MSAGAKVGRTFTRTAMRWWQALRRQAGNERSLEEASSRRLADAVLARADVISARDQVHHDMLRMMWYFGVDPGQIPPRFRDALRDAERICAHCLAVGRCQHWFHGRLSDDAPRSFCPNAELYEKIALGQQQAPDSNESPATW
jgi:uncharacterized protein YjiS (DUF1127 family)